MFENNGQKKTHTVFASIGKNWERTITLFSGGKLYSATGWRIGWAIAPTPLLLIGAEKSLTAHYTFEVPA